MASSNDHFLRLADAAVVIVDAQREYVEWVSEAKRDETRTKRLATTIEWLAEGNRRPAGRAYSTVFVASDPTRSRSASSSSKTASSLPQYTSYRKSRTIKPSAVS